MSAAVRVGYKQTEVGVIPADWEVFPISTLTTEFRGGAPLKPADFTDRGVKVLPKGGVGRTGVLHIAEKDLQYCCPEYADAHPRNQVNRDYTIVVLRDLVPSGPSIGLMVEIGTEESFVLAQGVYGFKVNSARADARYLIQLSNTSWYRNLANSIMVGSTQVHITNTAFKRAVLPVPAITEQRTISTALSDVDALLSKLDALIAKKRDLKQAAMQQLLTGQTRLPGFSGEWEVKRLGDIGDCLRGVTYKGDSDIWPHDTAQTKRLLRSNNVQNAVVVFEDMQFVNSERVSSHQLLRPNDILICMANGSKALVGKAGLFSLRDGYDYTFGAFMGCFRSNNATSNSSFVFYLFQTGRYRDYINNLLAGSSINNLSPGSIESLEFQVPTLAEQTAIATVLSDMDAELSALEARRDKTRSLKQGMMQELLTGRIRLV